MRGHRAWRGAPRGPRPATGTRSTSRPRRSTATPSAASAPDRSGRARRPGRAGPASARTPVPQRPSTPPYSRSVPEGHTVHRLAARHRELFAGRRVTASSPQGRFAEGAGLLSGRVLRDTEAAGKHLFHRYPGGRTLHVHLGLYGRFTDGTGIPPAPVGEVRLRMTSRGYWLDLRGPAACEVL